MYLSEEEKKLTVQNLKLKIFLKLYMNIIKSRIYHFDWAAIEDVMHANVM